MSNQAEEIAKLAVKMKEDAELNKRIQSLEDKANKEPSIQKLKWKGKAEQFGFIFSELAKKGFIEIPGTHGDASYSKYAKVCFDLFEFEKETTLENLKRAMNPNKNMLSESNRAKIIIPGKEDIS
jgi:hypothetical protein